MNRRITLWIMALAVLVALFLFNQPDAATQAAGEPVSGRIITGLVVDPQGLPISEAEASLWEAVEIEEGEEALAHAETHADGRYILSLPDDVPDTLYLEIERAHFQTRHIELQPEVVELLRDGQAVVMDDVALELHINTAFWVTTVIFVVVLALIAAPRMHSTLAAMMGATLLFGVSYLGQLLSEDFLIFDFERGMEYIDGEVLLLIVGMMIVVAVVERTGLFQWLAFAAYRTSRGKLWLLLPVLMIITGITSAFLDNVTTMLLMTPITIQIGLALGISPLALLIPQVLASNVAGISTLVGTPTNILIGSYADISFGDFLVNQTGGVILAMIGLVLYSEWSYRRQLKSDGDISPVLAQKLGESAQITQPENLKKAGVVGAGMLLLFVFGESFGMVSAITAMLGAVALLLWVQPDIEEVIETVDWTTIAFFMSLFLLVGGLQEVGVISIVAQVIGDFVGGNLLLAMIIIIWSAAIGSAIVDNIPFATAMLPVVGFLTHSIPGADSMVLFYCLSVGAAMGGNGSLIGSSANLVTAGISERAGYSITYGYFLKKGAPSVLITVALATLWLLIRFPVS